MKFLFYFAHPAQYLALRETIVRLSSREKHTITILIKTKDVLEELIKTDGLSYTNILPKERGATRLAMLLSLFKRMRIILPIILKQKPDLLIGTDAALAQLGKLLNIHRITILEDDYAVIKNLADLTFPFTQTILCPDVCNVGSWQSKKVGYKGYMKLGYLHPNVFTADNTIPIKYGIPKDYVLIRLSRLAAHHDIGVRGLDENLLDQIIQTAKKRNYSIRISAEGQVAPKYNPYLLQIGPSDIHHVLANAKLLISDSQSMSVEASMLGIPSIRYSSLVNRISVLTELETKYNLTIGIQIGETEMLLSKINELLSSTDLYERFQNKRRKMLADKIDVTSFWVDFFENYPKSKQLLKGSNVAIS
ncbi:DUF354 domain-containing protein [Spirosoma daeguense]